MDKKFNAQNDCIALQIEPLSPCHLDQSQFSGIRELSKHGKEIGREERGQGLGVGLANPSNPGFLNPSSIFLNK